MIGKSLTMLAIGAMPVFATPRPAPAGEPNLPRTTARMLVDLARDQGLMRQGRQTPADVGQIVALLNAATEIDPSAPDPYVWQYELAALRGDTAAAFGALDRLVRIDTENEGALEQWVAFGASQAQSVEGRRDWLKAQLKNEAISPHLRALIRAHLARLALRGMNPDAARIQLDRAIAIDETLPEIASLRLELLPEDASPQARIRAGLAALRVNPFQVDLAWTVGRLLAETGFIEQAGSFYTFALAVNQAANPGAAVPPMRALDLARLEAARGALDDAEFLVRRALKDDPVLWPAQFYLHWLLKAQEHDEQAAALVKQLSAVFDQISDPKRRPLQDVAQAAWFYCTLKPTPQRALLLAGAAAALAPGDPFVVRALGCAQALNGQTEKATATLSPIAAKDPEAAYQLARLMEQSGNTAAVRRLLDNLSDMPTAGPARERLASLTVALPAAEPAERRCPDIANLLADFDMGLLAFYKAPAQYLRVEVVVENPAPALGEPWWVRFTITNNAAFRITLGSDRMVNPVFLLSFDLQSEKSQSYPHLFTISMDRKRVLLPGESASIRRTIDIGPLRRASRRMPQQLLHVTMNVLFDPQRDGQGRWTASVSGQKLPAIVFNRVPAMTGPGVFQSLFAALRDESKRARFGAIETLATLLGERQRFELHRLSYRPEPVPAARIRSTLIAALSGSDWETRVHVLDAMQSVGFDQKMLDAVRLNLRHPHWLVRMMAVRLLGERQGKPFLVMARRIAEQDEHELVREMAAGYVARWQADAAATQPSRAP